MVVAANNDDDDQPDLNLGKIVVPVVFGHLFDFGRAWWWRPANMQLLAQLNVLADHFFH